MHRKILGVFTAVAAALLLVGVAWASGDREDSSSGTVAASAGSDVSSSVSLASRSTGTSAQDNTPTSVENSAPPSADDSTSTSIRVVDTSSTNTSSGEGSTSTSLDDDLDDDRAVAITTEPRTYDVDGAGTVGIQVVAGRLVLLDVGAASGWSVEIDKADSRDIKVEFENGDSDARFEAKIRDGELRVEMKRD